MVEYFFEEHPIIKAIIAIGAIDTLLYFLGFKEGYQLAVITFIVTIIIMVIYFDNRIKVLEKRIENLNNPKNKLKEVKNE